MTTDVDHANSIGLAIRHGLHVAMLLGLAFASLNLLGRSVGAASNDYLLGAQDKVRVRTYEWRASRDEIFDWFALNGNFTIGPAGLLSLPLIGEIPATGISTSDLANAISERLQSKMELGRRPDVSVEVVQFRPFYVVGHVDKPGEFPYRPGLTVLQALSIAGGLQRIADYGLLRLQRDAISAKGDLNLFGTQVNNLRARRARLQAELKRSESIEFPRELSGRASDASIALAMQQEQVIFDARREAFATQLRALEQLKSHLEKELVSLNALLEVEETQIRLVKKELHGVSALVEKRLTVTPRQLSLERTLAQIEGERLRVGTTLLRAKQDISRTEIAILELRNKRTNDVALDLRETQAKLDDLDQKAGTTAQLLHEAEVIAPQLLSQHLRRRRVQPLFTIMRQIAARSIELSASESTLVEPGDTIKVEVPSFSDPVPSADASSETPDTIKPAAATRARQGHAAEPGGR